MSASLREIELFCPKCAVVNLIPADPAAPLWACTACSEPLRLPPATLAAAPEPSPELLSALQQEPTVKPAAPTTVSAEKPGVGGLEFDPLEIALLFPVQRIPSEPAPRSSRFAAYLIDNGLLFLIAATAYFVSNPGMMFSRIDAPVISLHAFAIGCYLAYQMVLLGATGQTIGKRLMHICIVRYEDEANPGFLHAVLLRSVAPALLFVIPPAGLIFMVLDPLFIFGGERRCLHDVLAGTKVICA